MNMEEKYSQEWGDFPVENRSPDDNLGKANASTVAMFTKRAKAAASSVPVVAKAAVSGATVAVNVVIPHFDPLPLKDFFVISFCCAIPSVAFIISFTMMGYGVSVYQFFSTHFEPYAIIIGPVIGIFVFILYILDFQYWKSPSGKLARRVSVLIIVVAMITLLLSVSGNHPYSPINVYLVTTAMWLTLVKTFLYTETPMKNYVAWLSGPLFFNSILAAMAWFIWVFSDKENEWTIDVKLSNAKQTGCEPVFEDLEYCRANNGTGTDPCFFDQDGLYVGFSDSCGINCRRVYEPCLNTFMIWAGPFLVSSGLLFLSFFTTFVSRKVSAEEEMARFAKVWVILLFAVWVAASLAGAGKGLAKALGAITLCGFIASGVFLVYSFKRIEREEHMQRIWEKLIEKFGDYLNAMKGLLVLTFTPVALLYMIVSGLKQIIRNLKCMSCARLPKPTMNQKQLSGILTIEARSYITEFLSWDRASVFTCSIYWGMLIGTTILASKFTTLFFTWFIEQMKALPLGVVTTLMVVVGITMFLLPPVPGLPIYFTMGIVMIPVGKEYDMGIAWSIVYAIAISFFVKLFATVLQHKMIGGLLKNHVGVRQLVCVNSPLIRTMKFLLKEKGFTFAKVCILCGGPDWPTSVLCGLIDLPLLPNIIGTLPVFALVLPSVLWGSFLYMSAMPEYDWAGVATTICGALMSIVLFGFMLLAAFYVEQTLSTRKEEIDNMPFDEEVKVKDDAEEALNAAYLEVIQWEKLPISMKIILYLAVFFMIVFCYGIQLYQEGCFENYQLTDTIELQLEGQWTNLVKKPLGWISISIFFVSIIFFLVFKIWAKREAAKQYEEGSIVRKELELEDLEDDIHSVKVEEAETSFETTAMNTEASTVYTEASGKGDYRKCLDRFICRF